MGILIFVFLNSVVITGSFLLATRVLGMRRSVDVLISLFILYLAQIIVIEQVLGLLGVLNLMNVILVSLSVFLIISLLTKDNVSAYRPLGAIEAIRGVITNKILYLGLCIIIGFGCVKILINLCNPPFGWDSLNYHFTFAVEWLKSQNLNIPIVVSDDPSPSYYPLNGSLFYFWLMLPLKNVFLADVGQVPFYVLGALALYGIGRKIGLEKEHSVYGVSLFLLIPNFFKQLQIAYVDVMVAALFLVCVYFLILLSDVFSWQNVIIFSTSTGLLLGLKTISLPYSLLLIVPFVYLCFQHVQKLYFLFYLLLGILILGSFSYIRNCLETGNPLYPLDFVLLGKTIFRGVMDFHAYSARFELKDYSLEKILFHEGLGLQTLLFVLPSTLLALPIVILKNRKALTFKFLYVSVLPILIYAAYRYLIPLANVRYIYAMLGIGIILGLYMCRFLNIPGKIINYSVAACMLASCFELAKRQELIASVILTLLFFFLLSRSYGTILALAKNPFFTGLLVAGFLSCVILCEKWYVRNEFPRYYKMAKYSGFWPETTLAWDWLNRNTTGNNIAYVGKPLPFPLYGSYFKNNVFYASVNRIDPLRLHLFRNSRYAWGYHNEMMHQVFEEEGNYRQKPDYHEWMRNLIRRNADFLFIYSLHHFKENRFPIEEEWALNHAKKFNLAFHNNSVRIYKIIK